MVSPYPRRWLVLKSLLWRKRMRTVSPEHAEWDTIQKMASLWGHQKCPASLTSASPVLGFVCNRSKHLHKPKDYFPKLTCLPLGKIQLPDEAVCEEVIDKRSILLSLCLYSIFREDVQSAFLDQSTADVARIPGKFGIKSNLCIFVSVAQLKMGRNELFCVNCYNFCAMPLNVKKVSVTLSHQGASSASKS